MRLGERGAVLVRRLAVVDLELVALLLDDLGRERLARVVRESGLEGPVLLRFEGLDLALAVDDEPERDGLDAARGEAVADLLPEERRHGVAHETVDDSPSLLRIDEVLVDVPRMLERFLNGGGGDLVEGDAAELGLGHLDDVREMPGDRLPLPVEVGRQPDVIGGLRFPAERPSVLLRVVGNDVLGHERLEVHAHLRLGEISDVAERGLDLVVRTEHPF